MSNDLQSYLASKYMSGPKAEAILNNVKNPLSSSKSSKKKKNKLKSNASHDPSASTSGLVLRDADDDISWKPKVDDEEETQPVVENTPTFKSKKTTDSHWEIIKPSKPSVNEKDQDGDLDEDRELEDERPQVVETIQGGLQTASQIKAKYPSSSSTTTTKKTLQHRSSKQEEEEEETIYRDSQGKKIDTKLLRAQEKRKKALELDKQIKKMEWGKGLVQRQQRKNDAEELSRIAALPFARTIDDKDLNDEMKNHQRWNDPAAAFLTKTRKNKEETKRPKYNGPPAAPNRYGISPGFRWDGVDRSNGFEKKFFQHSNLVKIRKADAYNYSVDEM